MFLLWTEILCGVFKGCPLRRRGCGENRLRVEPRGKAFPLFIFLRNFLTSLEHGAIWIVEVAEGVANKVEGKCYEQKHENRIQKPWEVAQI